MENPADHQCIEWKTTFPVNMFVSDRFYRPQRSRVCRLPGLLRQTHVRDTGAAAIRVDDSHCTKSVTAAATYDTDDEAVAIANNSIYGLSGEVSSADTERALRVAQRMRTGSVTVNGSTFFGIARWAAPNRADWADATASRASRNTSKSRPSACPPDEVLRYFGEGVTECLSGWSKALFAQMGEQDSAGWSALEWDKTDVVAQI